jgi:hypothetical protein
MTTRGKRYISDASDIMPRLRPLSPTNGVLNGPIPQDCGRTGEIGEYAECPRAAQGPSWPQRSGV